jgi:predicted metal-dependent phosphoesterase TrpH
MQEIYDQQSDWHVHTHLSDGRAAPREILQAAHAIGLRRLAITDHDCLDAHRDAALRRDAAGCGLELIPGIEIDCTLEDLSIEVLGYRFNADDEPLNRRLREIQAARRERVRFLADGLSAAGEPLDAEALLAGETVAFLKAHLFQALAAAGRTFAGGYPEFRGRLAELGPAPPLPTPTAEEAVALIRAAGGYALLAHPLYYLERREAQWVVERIRAAGCRGVEFAYPYDYGGEGLAPDAVAGGLARLQAALAAAFPQGALRSRGSDVHDPPQWPARLRRVAAWEAAGAA